MHLSEAEWKVMRALWGRHSASVRDVLEAVEGETGWAYSTVKTLLGRLAEKGAVSAEKRANVLLFEPRVSEKEARRSALRGLLDRAFDGTFGSLVHHLVAEESLSERDRRELRELIEEAGKGAEEESP